MLEISWWYKKCSWIRNQNIPKFYWKIYLRMPQMRSSFNKCKNSVFNLIAFQNLPLLYRALCTFEGFSTVEDAENPGGKRMWTSVNVLGLANGCLNGQVLKYNRIPNDGVKFYISKKEKTLGTCVIKTISQWNTELC